MAGVKENNSDLWNYVLDTAVEGLVAVDGKGVIRHINLSAQRELQLKTNAVGRHFQQVFCPSLPLDKCWVNEAISKRENLRKHRFNMQKKSGAEKELFANLTFLNGTKSPVSALISIWSENQDKINEEKEKHQAILGSLAEGLFTVDNEWHITSFNRAAEKLTGWTESEVIGKYCKHLFNSETCYDGCPLAETLRCASPIFDYEMNYTDKCGKRLPVYVNTAVLYNSNSEAIGGVISFRGDNSHFTAIDGDSQTDFHGIIGKNRHMLEIYDLIREVSASNSTVLILGESGTGKELIAKAIQKLSSRKLLPYVRVNCAAIPDTLLESELFGHVKGAFTDAYTDRIGRFALANSGTIFLDEIGDLTQAAQLRLLRVLEEGEFQRLGSSETTKVDVRVIAATNRNLWQMVQNGTFRDDLYYRLNVIPVELPALRDRRDDLPPLIDFFIQKFRSITKRPITDISDKAYDLLMAYDYPGNIRELENIIEHAFTRTKSHIINENKLPVFLRNGQTENNTEHRATSETNLCSQVREALIQTCWNREKAAQKLGMSRTTLWRRMKEYDLLKE